MTTPEGNQARRWITPEGVRIELAHGTHSSPRNRDGWSLTTRHPASGVIMARVHFGRSVPEAELTRALDAVRAVPWIGPWPKAPSDAVSR